MLNTFKKNILICFGEEKPNMLSVLVVLQVVLLAVGVALLLRRTALAPADPRQAGVPDQLVALGTKLDGLDAALRSGLSDVKSSSSLEAAINRESSAKAFAELRGEVTGTMATLGQTVKAELGGFRADYMQAAGKLQADVHAQHEAIAKKLGETASEARVEQDAAREMLHRRLTELGETNAAQHEQLRARVGESLERLSSANEKKLEEMRVTVDEKLQKTLQSRLTESFGQVTMHLGEVQRGLGEMKELATGVGDLKKVLSNVKSRGIVGEFQLGQQLEQMFSPEQYIKNARIKGNTSESVEYALKFPNGEGPGGYTLLPIDAKFPKEDWERLEHAYEQGSAEEIAAAGRAFERTIRTEAERICKKYIDPPTTLPHGIMFLPTENLYAEVVRRPGLQSEIQGNCRVTVAGPSTFMAILTSFQMGFHTLAIEKKGDEVWKVLSKTKKEFETFGGMMDKVRKQVDTVQNTLGTMAGKTTTINRALKDVSSIDTGAPAPRLLGLEEISSVAPLLAAVAEEDE